MVRFPLHTYIEAANSECLVFYNSDAENSEASSQKPMEEKAVTPSPEQVFAECSQKRILGLLAAMLPPLNSVRDKWLFFFFFFDSKKRGGIMYRKKFWKTIY